MAEQPPLKPVYLLTGSDRPKIERALGRLRARIGEGGVEYVQALDAAAVVSACNSLGLLASDARLVIANGVDKWKKADVEAIAAYLADPTPGTVLAFVADDLKTDGALAKLCAKSGQVLAFSVAKRDLEDVVVADLELDVQRLAECLADFLVAADGGLPPLEADASDDLVDPVHDVVDNDRSVVGLEGLELNRPGIGDGSCP